MGIRPCEDTPNNVNKQTNKQNPHLLASMPKSLAPPPQISNLKSTKESDDSLIYSRTTGETKGNNSSFLHGGSKKKSIRLKTPCIIIFVLVWLFASSPSIIRTFSNDHGKYLVCLYFASIKNDENIVKEYI